MHGEIINLGEIVYEDMNGIELVRDNLTVPIPMCLNVHNKHCHGSVQHICVSLSSYIFQSKSKIIRSWIQQKIV